MCRERKRIFNIIKKLINELEKIDRKDLLVKEERKTGYFRGHRIKLRKEDARITQKSTAFYIKA